MMRSLFSAISGLETHQSRMDVIGNNKEQGTRTGPLPPVYHDRFKVDLIQRKCKSVAMVVSADRRYSSTRS